MSDEDLGFQVYIAHEPMVVAFRAWVRSMGWHLQGPMQFGEDDHPTHFLQPMASEDALGRFLKGERA